MQELSSQTRDQTLTQCSGSAVLTPGLPGKSLFFGQLRRSLENRKEKSNQSLFLGLGGRPIRIHCLFWLHHTAHEIFVLQQGIERLLLAVKSRTPNH